MTEKIFKSSTLFFLSLLSFMSTASASILKIQNENIPDNLELNSVTVTPQIVLSAPGVSDVRLKLPLKGKTSPPKTITNKTWAIALEFPPVMQKPIKCTPWDSFLVHGNSKLEINVSYEPGNPSFGGTCDVKVTDIK